MIEIEIPLYYTNIVFFTDQSKVTEQIIRKLAKKAYKESFEEWIVKDFYKHHKDVTLNGEPRQGLASYNGGLCIISVKDFDIKNPDHMGTLAHEIFHAADLILREKGLRLDDSSDEAWAYLIGYITKQFYSKYQQ